MRYRRAFIPGGSFFFTVVTEKRRPLLASADAVENLRTAFRAVRGTRPFDVVAMVVLPDHLHCIWGLPQGHADFATRWRLIKTWFTKHCDPALQDEIDFARHVDCIHFNPVKHGLVSSAIEWPYSSFRRHVEDGVYSPDWGQGGIDFEGVGHE